MITDEQPEVEGFAVSYDGLLQTPSGKLAVCSVSSEPFIEVDVYAKSVRVRLWANHPTEPNELRVLVSPFTSV